jgi:hypothetical protein
LIYLFISKTLIKERPSKFPKIIDPKETDAHSRALLNISSRSPVQEPSLQALFHAVPTQRVVPFLELSFTYHSQSPVYETPPDSRFPTDVKGPL